MQGLGTCWIAAMDKVDAKECLGIPLDHYIATVTPLGYPAESPDPPKRRSVDDMVRYLDGGPRPERFRRQKRARKGLSHMGRMSIRGR